MEEYRKLYDINDKTENPKGFPLPKVAAEATSGGVPLWRTDAEFGAQYTAGVNPAYIKRPGRTLAALASCFDLVPSPDVAEKRLELANAFAMATQRDASGQPRPGPSWLHAELEAGRIYVADVRTSLAANSRALTRIRFADSTRALPSSSSPARSR